MSVIRKTADTHIAGDGLPKTGHEKPEISKGHKILMGYHMGAVTGLFISKDHPNPRQDCCQAQDCENMKEIWTAINAIHRQC